MRSTQDLPIVLALALALAATSLPAAAGPLGLPNDLAADPEAQGFGDLLFAHGLLRLNAGDAAGALELFRAAAGARPDDATYGYFVGVALARLARHAEAADAFRHALPPARGRVPEARIRHDLGQALARQGDAGAAARELARAGELDRRFLSSLDAVGASAAPPRTELRVGLLVEHDDNPAQVNDDLPFVAGESDVRAVLRARAAYHPLRGRTGWTAGGVLHGYASAHQDFDAADLRGAQGVLQAAWGATPLGAIQGPLGYVRVPQGERRFGFAGQIGSAYFDLDGESFRRDHEVGASALVGQRGFGRTQLDARFADTTFFDVPTLDYSGDSLLVRVAQSVDLGSNPARWLRGAIGHTRDRADRNGLDRDTLDLTLELALPWGRRVQLFLLAARAETDYEDDSTAVFFTSEPREDTRTDLGATVVVGTSAHSHVTLRGAWIDRETDPAPLDVFSYERWIGSAGIHWSW